MAEVPEDRERIAAALRNVFHEDTEILHLRRLGGGFNNRSYLLRHGRRASIARLGDGGQLATLELPAEAELLRRAAAAGVAPEVLGFDAAGGVLFTQFLDEARPLSPAAVREPGHRARIAALLRRLHGIDAALPAFEPSSLARAYFEAARRRRALVGADRPLAAEFERLADEYRGRHAATVVCHNDLFAANILDGRGLKLIDFEFAVRGSPLLDLASLAAMNEYEPDDYAGLLGAYFAGGELPISVADFAKVVRLVRLMAYFWVLATAHADGGSELAARFGRAAVTAR